MFNAFHSSFNIQNSLFLIMHCNPFGTRHQENKGDWFNLTHIPDCKLWLNASPSPANVNNVKSGNAAQFTAANSEYLSVTDNAALSMGDIDGQIGGFFYFDSLPASGATMGLMGKWASGDLEYRLYCDNTGGTIRFKFDVRNTANDTTTTVTATTFGTPLITTPYFVSAYHNAATDLIGISVNDGAYDTAATTGGVRDGTADFEVGRHTADNYFNGRAQYCFIRKSINTAVENTFLYNSGNGRQNNELGITGTDGSNLLAGASNGIAYYNLGKESGQRDDSWGTNHLTDNATVTQNNGVSLKDPQDGDNVRQCTDLSGN